MKKSRRTDVAYGIVPIRFEGSKPKFLLIQHNAGHWAFPKGHAEKSETAEESARRELAEETGINEIELLSNKPFAEHYEIISKKWLTEKTVWFFVGITDQTEIVCQEEEVKAYAWLSEDDARDRITFEASRKTLTRACKKLKKK